MTSEDIKAAIQQFKEHDFATQKKKYRQRLAFYLHFKLENAEHLIPGTKALVYGYIDHFESLGFSPNDPRLLE